MVGEGGHAARHALPDAPHSEVKIVSCFAGAIYDVIVDLRPDSPTFRTWQAFELSAENERQLYIPAGFAHGFQTLTDDAGRQLPDLGVLRASASTGVSYDDPALGIDWPLPVSVISGTRPIMGAARAPDLARPVLQRAPAAPPFPAAPPPHRSRKRQLRALGDIEQRVRPVRID